MNLTELIGRLYELIINMRIKEYLFVKRADC
jgi:hypothetical protein